MASSLGSPPTKRELGKLASCGFAIVGLVFFLGLGWLPFYLMVGPSLWKTVMGEVKIKDHGTLCIGRAHDGDLSYNYYVRVRGAGDELENWTRVDRSSDPTKHSETALTSDSRYAAVSFESADGERMVIYDSVAKELWWNANDQWRSNARFVRAWTLLRAQNPRLPFPPY